MQLRGAGVTIIGKKGGLLTFLGVSVIILRIGMLS